MKSFFFTQVLVDGISEPLDKGLAMIWLFEEKGGILNRYVQSREPVLPVSTEVNTFWGQNGNVIDQNIVAKALKVSKETYQDKDRSDGEWHTQKTAHSHYVEEKVIFGLVSGDERHQDPRTR